jgi:hypothetical protein
MGIWGEEGVCQADQRDVKKKKIETKREGCKNKLLTKGTRTSLQIITFVKTVLSNCEPGSLM